jgi:hypothetical protein
MIKTKTTGEFTGPVYGVYAVAVNWRRFRLAMQPGWTTQVTPPPIALLHGAAFQRCFLRPGALDG